MNRQRLHLCLALSFCIMVSGCAAALDSAIDRAATRTGEKVGDAVGDMVGTAAAGYATRSLRNLSPALMQAYVMAIFGAVYHHGGYDFGYGEYQPGEMTGWRAQGMPEGEEFGKGFLARLDDGREWWQITSVALREGNREEVVLEALFSAPDAEGFQTLLRLRSLFPGDAAPSEVPVEENQGAYYHQPVRITEESLAAATTGVESMTTPAGTFRARHVVYRDVSGVSEWWLAENVPGGLVKYTHTAGEPDENGVKQQYSSVLTSTSRNAATRLGSY